MRVYSLIYLLVLSLQIFSQDFDRKLHDFGKVYDWNNPIAEFILTNNSVDTIVFLPTAYQRDVRIWVEEKKLGPGQSCKVQMQYYTEGYGRFEVDVQLYFSNLYEAVPLSLRGQIKSFAPEAITVCPTIEPSQSKKNTMHSFVVLDSLTRDSVDSFDLELVGSSSSVFTVDHSGPFRIKNLSPDLYELDISSFGYKSFNQTLYLNNRSVKTEILLPRVALHKDSVIPEDPYSFIESYDTQTLVQVEIPIVDTLFIEEPIHNLSTEEDFIDGKLNQDKYSPNHLIFLVDVSSSMAREEKLALLKYSMFEMINVLRPSDRVSIITYASNVEIVLSGISGAEKERLQNVIFRLEAKGQSHGSEGITAAYDLAHEHFIEGGNNEIVLASDGRFNSPGLSEKKLFRNINRQHKKSQIRFSCISFGKSSSAQDFMRDLSEHGNGSFVRITQEEMARSVLIELIKLHSYKESEEDWFISE